ncbi:GNAT family N-acetyltransferase [Streptomyces noursei]|uniref:GNAT family N-acetyltransferase n=1 Tax=Streptomyces noursei TaxID=1971 RepID=UPI001E5156E2|nr:GNAT family protein [Streptomyces noursei]MCZ1021074.1 GNAT family protein [Streptomyces noursei]
MEEAGSPERREAGSAVLGHLFRWGLHRVSAECNVRNTPSARLLERVGFDLEGRLTAGSMGHRTTAHLCAGPLTGGREG